MSDHISSITRSMGDLHTKSSTALTTGLSGFTHSTWVCQITNKYANETVCHSRLSRIEHPGFGGYLLLKQSHLTNDPPESRKRDIDRLLIRKHPTDKCAYCWIQSLKLGMVWPSKIVCLLFGGSLIFLGKPHLVVLSCSIPKSIKSIQCGSRESSLSHDRSPSVRFLSRSSSINQDRPRGPIHQAHSNVRPTGRLAILHRQLVSWYISFTSQRNHHKMAHFGSLNHQDISTHSSRGGFPRPQVKGFAIDTFVQSLCSIFSMAVLSEGQRVATSKGRV